MSHWFTGLFLVAILPMAGCGQRHVILQERLLAHPNPTNYDFNASSNDVKEAIKQAFKESLVSAARTNRTRVWNGNGDPEAKRLLTMLLQLPPGNLFWKGDADALSRQLLTMPGNENDAYFYASDSPVGESPVYSRDGQPLIYFADFHIHLATAGPRKTRVEIFTYDSRVNTGIDAGWAPAHGRRFIYLTVPPTTVEEYQILLGIGVQLGTMGMPVLETPGPNSPTRELRKRIEQ